MLRHQIRSLGVECIYSSDQTTDNLRSIVVSLGHTPFQACFSRKWPNKVCMLENGHEGNHYFGDHHLMSIETTGLNDQQRAQLLQLYKSKLFQLGDDAFFDDFDNIRRECFNEIGISIEEIEAAERAKAAKQLGKRGGESTSDDKVNAARENGRKGGKKKSDKSQLGLSLEDI